ncbi:hypothetical protein ACFQ58_16550 [Agromyces sp. NPDC056523]|uniref:hypothetical protein n=1 Tax=Agromyces sp. NPDC056523 TaxID=3345850 RepID=UPI00366E882D
MTAAVPVLTDLHAYRVAVAELPASARLTADPAGAIVVVDGATAWWDAAARAIDAPAAAIVVDAPIEVPLDAVRALAAPDAVPILVHRPRVRHDLVAVALEHRGEAPPPRVVVAEGRASVDHLPALVRDAIGWIRAFGGGPVDVASGAGASVGVSALLRSRSDGRVVGSLIAAAIRPDGEWLRIQALGETTTEFELDAALGRCELATSTSRGRLVAPTRFESGERAVLRRAMAASLESSDVVGDLAGLIDDEETAAIAFGLTSANFS